MGTCGSKLFERRTRNDTLYGIAARKKCLYDGQIAFAPPGSLALTSMLLGEFMLMGKHFFERGEEEINVLGRVRMLADIRQGEFHIEHTLDDGTGTL